MGIGDCLTKRPMSRHRGQRWAGGGSGTTQVVPPAGAPGEAISHAVARPSGRAVARRLSQPHRLLPTVPAQTGGSIFSSFCDMVTTLRSNVIQHCYRKLQAPKPRHARYKVRRDHPARGQSKQEIQIALLSEGVEPNPGPPKLAIKRAPAAGPEGKTGDGRSAKIQAVMGMTLGEFLQDFKFCFSETPTACEIYELPAEKWDKMVAVVAERVSIKTTSYEAMRASIAKHIQDWLFANVMSKKHQDAFGLNLLPVILQCKGAPNSLPAVVPEKGSASPPPDVAVPVPKRSAPPQCLASVSPSKGCPPKKVIPKPPADAAKEAAAEIDRILACSELDQVLSRFEDSLQFPLSPPPDPPAPSPDIPAPPLPPRDVVVAGPPVPIIPPPPPMNFPEPLPARLGAARRHAAIPCPVQTAAERRDPEHTSRARDPVMPHFPRPPLRTIATNALKNPWELPRSTWRPSGYGAVAAAAACAVPGGALLTPLLPPLATPVVEHAEGDWNADGGGPGLSIRARLRHMADELLVPTPMAGHTRRSDRLAGFREERYAACRSDRERGIVEMACYRKGGISGDMLRARMGGLRHVVVPLRDVHEADVEPTPKVIDGVRVAEPTHCSVYGVAEQRRELKRGYLSWAAMKLVKAVHGTNIAPGEVGCRSLGTRTEEQPETEERNITCRNADREAQDRRVVYERVEVLESRGGLLSWAKTLATGTPSAVKIVGEHVPAITNTVLVMGDPRVGQRSRFIWAQKLNLNSRGFAPLWTVTSAVVKSMADGVD